MSEIEVYQAPAAPAPAVPALMEIDSWTRVASQVIKLANEICDTPFVPVGLRGSAPATAAAILAGREMGLGPFTSLQHFHVIKGKVGQSALLMRALITGQGHQWQDGDVTDTRAVVRGRRKGEAEWTEVTFTADQARKGGVDLGGFPADKLYARATVRLARRKFADVVMGMPYSAEELEDGTGDGEAPAPAAEPAKTPQRTARRKAAQDPSPAAPATPTAADAGTPPAAAAGEAPMPPLPGEDEPSEPAGPPGGDLHRKRVGVVQGHFERLLGRKVKDETDDQRAERLWMAAKIAGVSEVGSLNDLDPGELSTVADTLAKCRNRERLEEILAMAGEGGA